MHNGSRHDIVEMHASAGDQTIVEIDEHDSYPYGVGAAGSMVAVSSGITVPQRQVRLPVLGPGRFGCARQGRRQHLRQRW